MIFFVNCLVRKKKEEFYLFVNIFCFIFHAFLCFKYTFKLERRKKEECNSCKRMNKDVVNELCIARVENKFPLIYNT